MSDYQNSNIPGQAPPQQPASPNPQPAAPYQQPAAPYQQPAAPYQQPAAPYQQPAAPYQQPAAPYQQPAAPYQQPAAPYQQPAAPYQQPAAPYQQPAEPYQQPAVSFHQPPAPKKKRSALPWVLAILMLVVGFGGGFFLKELFPEKSDSYVAPFGYDTLTSAKEGDLWGYIDRNGDWVIEPKFDEAYSFVEGYALVEVGGLYGFIDEEGDYLVRPKYEDADSFGNGLAAVMVDDKYGFINTEGELVIEPIYDDAGYFLGDYAPVMKDELWGYIDKKGTERIAFQFLYAGDMDGMAIVATMDKEYILIDEDGRQVGDLSYAGISYIDYTFCQKRGCYEMLWDDDYCSVHDPYADDDYYY